MSKTEAAEIERVKEGSVIIDSNQNTVPDDVPSPILSVVPGKNGNGGILEKKLQTLMERMQFLEEHRQNDRDELETLLPLATAALEDEEGFLTAYLEDFKTTKFVCAMHALRGIEKEGTCFPSTLLLMRAILKRDYPESDRNFDLRQLRMLAGELVTEARNVKDLAMCDDCRDTFIEELKKKEGDRSKNCQFYSVVQTAHYFADARYDFLDNRADHLRRRVLQAELDIKKVGKEIKDTEKKIVERDATISAAACIFDL